MVELSPDGGCSHGVCWLVCTSVLCQVMYELQDVTQIVTHSIPADWPDPFSMLRLLSAQGARLGPWLCRPAREARLARWAMACSQGSGAAVRRSGSSPSPSLSFLLVVCCIGQHLLCCCGVQPPRRASHQALARMLPNLCFPQ